MIKKVEDFIIDNNMIKAEEKILVALSGGPDSVCLLHILYSLKEKLNINLGAIHINHMLRGEEALEDERYVSDICEKLGIDCYIERIDINKVASENNISLEMAGREERYKAFENIRERYGYDKIAVAHNANDQAETILMRMMRGTGLEGLVGIKAVREGGIIRPILCLNRNEIESYCAENHLMPRIDKSNMERVYSRNKVRLDILPYMKENFNSNVTESIVRMSNSLKCDNEFIEEEALKQFRNISCINEGNLEIKIEKFKNLHKSLKSRIIRHGIKNVLGDTNFIDQKHIEEVIDLEGENKIDKRIVLPRGLFVYRQKGKLLFTTREIVYEEIEFSHEIPKNGIVKIDEANLIIETEVMPINKYKALKRDKSSKWFDCNKIKGGIIVRSRKSGDKIKLSMGSKKLKQLFIDLKIPKEERCKVPILHDDNGILCVGNFRDSEQYKVDETTKEVLKISFKKF